MTGAVLGVGIAGVPGFARLSYTLSAGIMARDSVAAARALGLGRLAIIREHVLPNISDTLAVTTATALGISIVEIASLSFLGLGVNPPLFDWGRMLVDSKEYWVDMPWMGIFPGLSIMITVLGFNLLGDGLRDAFDPKMKD